MKRNRLMAAGFAAVLSVAGACNSARAVLIDVDFNGPNGSGAGADTQTGAAAAGTAGDVWNGIGGSAGAAVPLLNSQGLPTVATLDFAADGAADIGTGSGNFSTFATSSPVYALMRDLLVSSPNVTNAMTIHNVPVGTYNLYVYSNSNINDNAVAVETRVTNFTVNGGTSVPVGPNNYPFTAPPGTPPYNDQLALGKNYNVIPVTVTQSLADPLGTGDVEISYVGHPTSPQTPTDQSDGLGQFNGFQLESVPEPTSMGLLSFGAAGLLAARRRRSLFA